MNNQNKQDNPLEVWQRAELILSKHHILGVLNQHGLTPVVKSAMDDHAAHLQSRIAELEALNDKYEKALENIAGYKNIMVSISNLNHLQSIANEALNS